MAASGSSLRFTVEVAADQADRALKAMAVAFNEAGASARIAMQSVGTTAKAAGAEVVTLGDKIKSVARDQRSEARAAAYYVQEIGSIIPISNNAKIALGGLGEALVGGVGIGAAVALVTTAIKLMTAAWAEEEAAAKKAAEERRKRLDEIQKDIDANRNRGKTPAELAQDQIGLLGTQVSDREERIAALRAATAAEKLLPASLSNDVLIAQNEAEIVRMGGEIASLKREIDKLREKIQTDIEAAARTVSPGAAPKAGKGAASAGAELKAEIGAYDAKTVAPKSSVTVNPLNINPEVDPLERVREMNREIARGREAQEEYNRRVEETAAVYNRWGQEIGNVVVGLAMGEMTARQAIASIGRMILQSLIQIGIQKVTAELARHAVEKPIKIADVIASAGVAGANAATTAAFLGPGAAAAAALATSQVVMGTMIPLASAARGWDLPAGGPFPAVLHSREMVLPEKYADVIRSGGAGITVNVGGAIVSSRDIEETFVARDGAVARAMRKMRRRRRM